MEDRRPPKSQVSLCFCDFVSVSNASSYSSSFFVKIAIFMVIQLSYVIPPFSETPETPFTTKLRLSRAPLSNDSYRKDGRGEGEMLLAKPCEIHKAICGCVATLEIGSTVQKCPKESPNPSHFIHDSNVIPLFQVNEKVRLTLFSIHISHEDF